MDVNDTSIFTGGGDGGIRQWPLATDSQNSKLVLREDRRNMLCFYSV